MRVRKVKLLAMALVLLALSAIAHADICADTREAASSVGEGFKAAGAALTTALEREDDPLSIFNQHCIPLYHYANEMRQLNYDLVHNSCIQMRRDDAAGKALMVEYMNRAVDKIGNYLWVCRKLEKRMK